MAQFPSDILKITLHLFVSVIYASWAISLYLRRSKLYSNMFYFSPAATHDLICHLDNAFG